MSDPNWRPVLEQVARPAGRWGVLRPILVLLVFVTLLLQALAARTGLSLEYTAERTLGAHRTEFGFTGRAGGASIEEVSVSPSCKCVSIVRFSTDGSSGAEVRLRGAVLVDRRAMEEGVTPGVFLQVSRGRLAFFPIPLEGGT